MKKLILDYDFSKLKEIIRMPNGNGLDFRFDNYPEDDISVETTKWENIQEFLQWYSQQPKEETK